MHSECGGVLPSTDARRITVREITVNICSMNMMRLAERRRGEEDNLLCHLSLYGCLSYITPSLSLYLPAHLSLTHFHHLSFSVLPSFPPTLRLSIFSHSHAQLNSLPHSLFLSHSSHLSLFPPLFSPCLFTQDAKPHLSHLRLEMPPSFCLLFSCAERVFPCRAETDLMREINRESPCGSRSRRSALIWQQKNNVHVQITVN